MNLPANLKLGGLNTTPWKWMLATLFFSQMFPEYIAPVFTLVGFIIMKRSFKKAGQKVRLDSFGKYEFIFMVYYLFTSVYSGTKVYSAAIALLWMGMCLGQLMMANLINTEEKLKTAMKLYALGGFIISAIACLQLISIALIQRGIIKYGVPNPLTGPLDVAVYNILINVFNIKIDTRMISTRALGTYNNPNLLATYLCSALPFSFYFLLNGKSRKEKVFFAFSSLTICAGVAVTQTRGAMIALVVSSVVLFLSSKSYLKKLFVLAAGILCLIPAYFTRYTQQLQHILNDFTFITQSGQNINVTLDYSTAERVKMYTRLFHYILHDWKVFIFGAGAGVENVGAILATCGLTVPHAHNIILELWAESGIIGLGLFIFAGGILLRNLILNYKCTGSDGQRVTSVMLSSLIAFFIITMTDYVICSPKILQVMFILFGFAQATYRIYQSRWESDAFLKENKKLSKEFRNETFAEINS